MSLAPQAILTDDERENGLRLLVVEAAFSSSTSALTSGVILTAFALHLGASNLWVGLLASAPFLTQLLQLPAIIIIERLRARKRIAALTSIAGRLMLLVMGATAFFTGTVPLLVFLFAQYVLCGLGAVGSCAWNSWLRDLAPEARLGGVFARRTSWTAGISLVAGLAAAVILERTAPGSTGRSIAFASMFAVGCVTGLISARVVSCMPEPIMPPPAQRLSLGELLRSPLSDVNFKQLLVFVISWQFAVNLATPFFTVFIVQQLGFNVSLVMILSALSQLANLAALRAWGTLSDRFSNKSVLLVSAPAYIAGIVAMIGASQSDNTTFVIGWLVFLHLLMGASVAGVTLASTNIALKLSPRGSATAYVAANATAIALAAGFAPIAGGLLADFFAARRFELLLRWTSPHGVLMLPLQLSHWDFYFFLAGGLGLYAIHRLSLVAEAGEIERREMMGAMLGHTWRAIRNVSSIAGLRNATEVPSALSRDARVQFRHRRARQSAPLE
ncbi:MFS transporter [Novosphingobium resinovorum]|uniref:MFS transporter n=1 Tax=Novosphingobium TaxID=165696 RepID=UPI001B3C7381|nr:MULTISPECIES: MFS transporter [Novosphingobium]MBF7013867.1 MFS transporter [Novosphingobium sp. HR1a]WJM26016.1 MFS transporter [Novosphingobium resinovorum]